LQEWEGLTDVTFGEAHFRFPDAIPIGVKEAGSPPSSIVLNPPDAFRFKPGDRLLVLAEVGHYR
jgi:hypothetical protein